LLTFLSSQTKGQDSQGLNPPLRNPPSRPEYIKNLFTNKTNCARVGCVCRIITRATGKRSLFWLDRSRFL